MKKDLYASEEDTKALLQSDTRTAAQKKLDALLEKRHAFEMGNEPYQVLYQIATELIEGKREAVELAFEAGRQQGIKQERALWELAKIGQEIEAMPEKQEPWEWQRAPTKTQWGHDMVVADLAIDNDHTVSVYCERDQTEKVEAMFTGKKI